MSVFGCLRCQARLGGSRLSCWQATHAAAPWEISTQTYGQQTAVPTHRFWYRYLTYSGLMNTARGWSGGKVITALTSSHRSFAPAWTWWIWGCTFSDLNKIFTWMNNKNDFSSSPEGELDLSKLSSALSFNKPYKGKDEGVCLNVNIDPINRLKHSCDQQNNSRQSQQPCVGIITQICSTDALRSILPSGQIKWLKSAL